MRVYKITDEYSETRGSTVWGEGVAHEAPGEGELCSAGWIHCYIDPRIAAFMYRVHVPFVNPVLWEAEAEPPFKYDGQLKMGCRKLTTIRKIPLPLIDIEQRAEIAIRCALSVGSKTDEFAAWAKKWLAGIDRSKESALAMTGAMSGSLWNASIAAASAATIAAAASAAASAATTEDTAMAAWLTASIDAALAAEDAAEAAKREEKELDLLAIINDVVLQERGECNGNGKGM